MPCRLSIARSRKPHTRLACWFVAACTFVSATGLAMLWPSGDAVSETAHMQPWAERAITGHVDQRALYGTLTGVKLRRLIDDGEQLFRAKFTARDGVGRPLATQAIIPTRRKRPSPHLFQRLAGSDASSCASCHTDPVVGGAGDFTVNAFVSEGFVNADFDTTDPQFSNERNTNHLFGAGLVELLAREMTVDLHRLRDVALATARQTGKPVVRQLVTKGVQFGTLTAHPSGLVDVKDIEGIDPDLVVRPFGQKGVFVSLRQFTVNALNHHHGMQATERFGARWTGTSDFDGDGKDDEIHKGDVTALVAWQATRPPPIATTPDEPAWKRAAQVGSKLFDNIGCATCHRRALPLRSTTFEDPAPYNGAGTLRSSEVRETTRYDLRNLKGFAHLPRTKDGAILVPLFGDLKRHHMTDRQIDALGNELLSQRFVDRNVFQTAELWGIASTAPYGHRGDLSTLDAVIRAHGGEGRPARDRYVALAPKDRSALIAFLKTLVIPQ